jgi:putative FmdB family regulatory protein
MPTYEYTCSACENGWETEQRITEAPVRTCPKCGRDTAKRQISGGTFILKGGGWYADLYSSVKASSGESTNSSSPPKVEEKKMTTPAESTAPPKPGGHVRAA